MENMGDHGCVGITGVALWIDSVKEMDRVFIGDEVKGARVSGRGNAYEKEIYRNANFYRLKIIKIVLTRSKLN